MHKEPYVSLRYIEHIGGSHPLPSSFLQSYVIPFAIVCLPASSIQGDLATVRLRIQLWNKVLYSCQALFRPLVWERNIKFYRLST